MFPECRPKATTSAGSRRVDLRIAKLGWLGGVFRGVCRQPDVAASNCGLGHAGESDGIAANKIFI
jgi:hypothetical protein